MLNHESAGQDANSACGAKASPSGRGLPGVCEVCGKPYEGLICPPCVDRIRAEAVARKIREDKGLE